MACVLTGHLLKDPNATVAYHAKTDDEYADTYGAKYGVGERPFRNAPVPAPNDVDRILQVIRDHAPSGGDAQ